MYKVHHKYCLFISKFMYDGLKKIKHKVSLIMKKIIAYGNDEQ